MDEFKYFASNSSLDCLRNSLPTKPVYKKTQAICGNGILEKGEQCDCGLATVSRKIFKNFLFFIMYESATHLELVTTRVLRVEEMYLTASSNKSRQEHLETIDYYQRDSKMHW